MKEEIKFYTVEEIVRDFTFFKRGQIASFPHVFLQADSALALMEYFYLMGKHDHSSQNIAKYELKELMDQYQNIKEKIRK